MRLANRILMFIIDGEEKMLDEFADHLIDSIDPAVAMRSFLRRIKGSTGGESIETMTVNKKVEIGCREIILNCLRVMRKAGHVNFNSPVNRPEKWREGVVRLTQEGLEACRQSKQNTGAVFDELKKMFRDGSIMISFTPTNGHELVPAAKEEEAPPTAADVLADVMSTDILS